MPQVTPLGAALGTVDWVSVSAFATAGGTLVLAIATFASVRSANRSARTAERALQVNLRPLLFPSRLQDPPVKAMWVDRHWASIPGSRAHVEVSDDDVVYLAMSLRNVGQGMAVIHGWSISGNWQSAAGEHGDPDSFRLQGRDLYIPPGDHTFWQGALRDPSDQDEEGGALRTVITSREPFSIELLYGDHEGGQRTISRFGIVPRSEADEPGWMCTVARHWNLDRPDPR